MVEKDKMVLIVSILNRLTQENKIKWTKENPPGDLTAARNESVFYFYSTRHEGRNLGLYEERSEAFEPEIECEYWESRIVLAVFDDSWRKLWEFPNVSGLYELFKSVGFQAADVGTYIDKIISEYKEEKSG